MTPLTSPAPPVRAKHLLDTALRPRYDGGRPVPTRIALVGAGGNGSQMMSCLPRIDRCLRALGLPPLHVTLYDPDRVSASNPGRQLFFPNDVGQSKAVCLIHRANVGFGLSWKAVPARYEPNKYDLNPIRDGTHDILITCVDTGAARHQIAEALWNRADAPVYWLDIGNEDYTGQVWLGQFPRFLAVREKGDPPRLPVITEAYPGFYDGTLPETDGPTCSLAEALQSQDLFINDHCARWGAELLWTLLRYAEIEHHGYWVNLRDGKVLPIDVPAEPIKPPAANQTNQNFQEAA